MSDIEAGEVIRFYGGDDDGYTTYRAVRAIDMAEIGEFVAGCCLDDDTQRPDYDDAIAMMGIAGLIETVPVREIWLKDMWGGK